MISINLLETIKRFQRLKSMAFSFHFITTWSWCFSFLQKIREIVDFYINISTKCQFYCIIFLVMYYFISIFSRRLLLDIFNLILFSSNLLNTLYILNRMLKQRKIFNVLMFLILIINSQIKIKTKFENSIYIRNIERHSYVEGNHMAINSNAIDFFICVASFYWYSCVWREPALPSLHALVSFNLHFSFLFASLYFCHS